MSTFARTKRAQKARPGPAPDDRQVRDRAIKSLLQVAEDVAELAVARVGAARVLLDVVDDGVPSVAGGTHVAIGVGINVEDLRERASAAIAAAFKEPSPPMEDEDQPRWLLPSPVITEADSGSGKPAAAPSEPPPEPAEVVSIPRPKPQPGSVEWLDRHHFGRDGRKLPRGY